MDTLTNIILGAGKDVFNFKNIGTLTAPVANGLGASLASSATGNIAMADKVSFLKDASWGGTLTATTLAGLIEGAGDALELASGGKGVVFTGEAGAANDKIQIWLVDDTIDGANGTVSAADVIQIGITAANLDINTFHANNVAFS